MDAQARLNLAIVLVAVAALNILAMFLLDTPRGVTFGVSVAVIAASGFVILDSRR